MDKALHGKGRQEAVIRNVYLYFAEATNVEGRLTDVRKKLCYVQAGFQYGAGDPRRTWTGGTEAGGLTS